MHNATLLFKALSLGSRAAAWVESEVQEGILERVAQRDGVVTECL
ncbi:AlpA family phage regulatory protein [Shewanella xiamenensis]